MNGYYPIDGIMSEASSFKLGYTTLHYNCGSWGDIVLTQSPAHWCHPWWWRTREFCRLRMLLASLWVSRKTYLVNGWTLNFLGLHIFIIYLVGKIKFKLLFQGPLAKCENQDPHDLILKNLQQVFTRDWRKKHWKKPKVWVDLPSKNICSTQLELGISKLCNVCFLYTNIDLSYIIRI